MHSNTEAHVIYLCEKSLDHLLTADFDGAYCYLVVARAEAGDDPTSRVRAALDDATNKLNRVDNSHPGKQQNIATSMVIPSWINLTHRELQIVKLASEGLKDKDIAECLGISARTVQNHLKRVYDKFGIRNRTEAARLMFGKYI